MDKDKLAKLLMATFLEELGEHVRALNRDLLVLEQSPSNADRSELWKLLFRSAHSLKGAARSVNVELIERACHSLEEILTSARDGQLTLTPEMFALLFETADAIEHVGGRLRESQSLDGSPLAALLPRLEKSATKSEVDRTPTSDHPEASDEARVSTPPVSPRPAIRSSDRPDLGVRATMSSNTVRVPAEKLDTLLAQSGELLVARRRVASRGETLANIRESLAEWRAEWKGVEKPLRDLLQDHERGASVEALPAHAAQTLAHASDRMRQLERDLDGLAVAAVTDGQQLDFAAGSLDAEVRRIRMLPFAQACQGLDRAVHDLARAAGKEVELVIKGGEVELDRSVLEGLKDPLLHLVRNAVDHGAELPDKRRERGKVSRARITVSAALRGNHVEVVVSDDGQGIDIAALREQVRDKGLPEPADDRELVRVIFQSGFSTARIITDVSGRGIGLDVVKSRVEALRGSVELRFEAGSGTRFVLAVPLTLTTLQVLLLEAGGQTFAIASNLIRRLVRINPHDLRTVQGREVLLLGDAPLPIASLADVLGLARPSLAQRASEGADATTPRWRVGLVCASEDREVVFVVEELLTEQEVVIKNLGARIRRVRHVSGATLLPSGRIALLLNVPSVIRAALSHAVTPTMAPTAESAEKPRRRLLVAEDVETTRILMKSILEAAGYDVAVAPDGAAAWQRLQEHGADLLVSDIDMPRMSGFDLTAAVRASSKFAKLPIILVTARETDADKAHGIEVGADAYLVKSAFDQRHLLETIAQLM
ncbi:MAG: response regulator [Planctomycetaceae bacterium]|nr:response regulator [Planctomycetaceae bacterium]